VLPFELIKKVKLSMLVWPAGTVTTWPKRWPQFEFVPQQEKLKVPGGDVIVTGAAFALWLVNDSSAATAASAAIFQVRANGTNSKRITECAQTARAN
jgi:hypothetical protein